MTSAGADVEARARGMFRPPPLLSLSAWAEQDFRLSPESSASPGRWRAMPFQVGIMDALTDPRIERVTLMKSARVGFTEILKALIGRTIAIDPGLILLIEPRIEDAQRFSKRHLAPMFRDCPSLRTVKLGQRELGVDNTMQEIMFPGGALSLIGSNSPAGFRERTIRLLICDEVDAYPESAGEEGDPISLAIRRTETFRTRKILLGSTPMIAGTSRIEQLFRAGDQRYYLVPCPQCGHLDRLTFREEKDGGHWMQWPEGQPERAHFVCSRGGCVIEERDKRAMLAAGEWRATSTFSGHASFHVWSAYSHSPGAGWGEIASDFVTANREGPRKLQTFVNTRLGETWQEVGEAPDWQRLYERRETYQIGTVPAGVVMLTCGVDVQNNRLPYEVVGWGEDRQSWSIEAGALLGKTESPEVWLELDRLLDRTWPGVDGREWRISRMGVDSGYATQTVYNWTRGQSPTRVCATKGVAGARALVGAATPVDVKKDGRRIARGARVFLLGPDIGKDELYKFLRQDRPVDGSYPPGWCHFPEYGEDFFKQLTAEHLVKTRQKRTGVERSEWMVLPNRENHMLDARVIARAMAALEGLDRIAAQVALRRRAGAAKSAPPPAKPQPGAEAPPAARKSTGEVAPRDWWSRRKPGRGTW